MCTKPHLQFPTSHLQMAQTTCIDTGNYMHRNFAPTRFAKKDNKELSCIKIMDLLKSERNRLAKKCNQRIQRALFFQF